MSRIVVIAAVAVVTRGRPVLDATVLVFAADPEQWTRTSRYFGLSRPDRGGRFLFPGLPPRHDYRIIAVRGVELGGMREPSFLQSIRDVALALTLADGEKKVQNLILGSR